MSTNALQQVQHGVTYLLEYIGAQGKPRSVILCPAAADLANGVILSETREGSGVMKAQLLSGKTITVALTQILKVEKYKVTTFNGQTSKTQTVNEQGLESILDRATNPETGEVEGNIRSIEQVGNPDNKVTKRRGEL